MIRKIVVGSELESYCGKCKMELNHVVVAMVDDAPKRVQCLTCKSVHNHRLLKTKVKKTAKPKKKKTRAKSSKVSATAKWNALMPQWDDASAKPYSIYDSFSVNDWIDHGKFGRGGVTEVLGPDKIITLFESGEKMLMHGKKRSS